MTTGGRSPSSSVRSIATAILLALFLSHLTSAVSAEENDGSEHDYHNDPFTFLFFTFLMSFATMGVLFSIFAFKFGTKRARLFAAPLLVCGLVPWGFWIIFNLILRTEYPHDTLLGIVHWVAAPLLLPIMALLGAALGMGVALFIFLTIIVRS